MKKTFALFLLCALPLSLPAHAEGDATHGGVLFNGTAQCKTCHKVDHNLVGPMLGGVYGRKIGSVPNFAYSAGMKTADWTWDVTTLDKWLASPKDMVPGTHMTMHVEKEQDRADIIAYLKTLPKSE